MKFLRLKLSVDLMTDLEVYVRPFLFKRLATSLSRRHLTRYAGFKLFLWSMSVWIRFVVTLVQWYDVSAAGAIRVFCRWINIDCFYVCTIDVSIGNLMHCASAIRHHESISLMVGGRKSNKMFTFCLGRVIYLSTLWLWTTTLADD